MVYLFISIRRCTIDNLFVTFGQSSATKILTQGVERKWGDHRRHKSSLRHTSSRAWFIQTIDATTTSGHIHICLSCGSCLAEGKKSSGLITALSKRRQGLAMAEKAFVCAVIPRQAGRNCFQCEMSNSQNCVYLTWFIWWLWFGMKVSPNDHEGKK